MFLLFWAAVVCVLTEGAVIKLKRDLTVSNVETRIVGGEPATIEEIPYQLSFRTDGQHFCGASIINAYHALTAAHCCIAYTWSSLEVDSGSADLDGGQPHAVVDVFVHPKYNDYLTDYDACVLRISTPFEWSNTTQPIKIVPLGLEPLDFEPVVVSGWGSESEGGSDSETLMKVSVNILPHSICNLNYNLHLTSRMICAGQIGGGKDSCQGDSGGPLHGAFSGRQVGIVSWGYGCAEAHYPGIYTDVANPEINSFIRIMSHLRIANDSSSSGTDDIANNTCNTC